MSVLIGHASISENGSKNGIAGDSTGKEVCIRNYYAKGWTTVLRPKSPSLASESVKACIAGCKNDNIGYSQFGSANRNTAYLEWKRVGDISKLGKCNTDCSAFMTLCAIIGGCTKLNYSSNAPTTSTMVSTFKNTGDYEALSFSSVSQSLKPGDILVKPGSHTAMIISVDGNLSDYETGGSPSGSDGSGSGLSDVELFKVAKDALANVNYKDVKARIKSYRNLKDEFYNLNIDDDKEIDKYIKIFQQFNDEFLDLIGELGITLNGGTLDDLGYTDSGNYTGMTDNDVDDLISLAKTKIGSQYVYGMSGPDTFDCSGFVTWLLKEIGVMPKDAGRLTVGSIPSSSYFTNVKWNKRKKGDFLIPNGGGHVVVYEGNGQVIHASHSAPYPKGGVKESKEFFTGKAYRIKGFGVV